MNRKRLTSCVLTLAMALLALVLVACGGGSTGGGESAEPAAPSPEELVKSAQLSWNGYTMGIDLVELNEVQPMGMELEGQALHVVFCPRGDTKGFDGTTILDDLQSNQIVVRNAEGDEFEQLGAVSDITVETTDGNFGMSKEMPRFGIFFDVPKDTKIEDYTLSVGDDNDLQLVEYTSEEYAADKADTSE